MRILVLTDVLFPDTVGGAGRVAYHLCDEFREKGHEVHVLTRNVNRSSPSTEILRTGFFIHRFNIPPGETSLRFFSEIARSLNLARRIRENAAFDIAIVHQSLPAIGPILSGCLKGLPFIYLFHSPWHEEYMMKRKGRLKDSGPALQVIARLMKWMENRTLLKASLVVVLSRYMQGKVHELHSLPSDKLRLIPGGVDLARFRLSLEGKMAAKKVFSLSMGKTIFLTVRNLVPRMGLESLIEAFRRSSVLRDKGLLLLGGEGPLKGLLTSLIEDYDLHDSVRLLGHIQEQDLPRSYQAADFFVLPTRELEGFGLVILEAMASGTPVLGTPVGAIPELIRPFDPRLLFESTGWEDMARKLEDVLLHPEHYSFDAQACRRYVEDRYSWERMAAAFEEEMMGLLRISRRLPAP